MEKMDFDPYLTPHTKTHSGWMKTGSVRSKRENCPCHLLAFPRGAVWTLIQALRVSCFLGHCVAGPGQDYDRRLADCCPARCVCLRDLHFDNALGVGLQLSTCSVLQVSEPRLTGKLLVSVTCPKLVQLTH